MNLNLTFDIRVVKLHQASNRAFSNEKVRSTPSTRESTSTVACVEEDRVRLAGLHCVLRHLCARGVLHGECKPIVHEPTVSTRIYHDTIHELLLAQKYMLPVPIDRAPSRNPDVENVRHEPRDHNEVASRGYRADAV